MVTRPVSSIGFIQKCHANVMPAGPRISRSFHLQSVVKLPHLSSKQADQNTGSEAAASITRSTIRAPRPQLKGLKMRFRPIGSGDAGAGTLGDPDSEDNAPQKIAALDLSNELSLPVRKEKRKQTEANGYTQMETQSKKHKKKHTEANGENQMELQPKKPKKHRTPEEKAARKEKKRARDAA